MWRLQPNTNSSSYSVDHCFKLFQINCFISFFFRPIRRKRDILRHRNNFPIVQMPIAVRCKEVKIEHKENEKHINYNFVCIFHFNYIFINYIIYSYYTILTELLFFYHFVQEKPGLHGWPHYTPNIKEKCRRSNCNKNNDTTKKIVRSEMREACAMCVLCPNLKPISLLFSVFVLLFVVQKQARNL